MISRMTQRCLSSLLFMLALVPASSVAQKCKGLDVKYESEIQYPNSARAARIQGDVTLQVHIVTDGTVTPLSIARDLTAPHPANDAPNPTPGPTP